MSRTQLTVRPVVVVVLPIRSTIHLVGLEWPAAPVHGDLGEQPMLDLVPFTGPGGRWQTVIASPVSAASWASSIFQARIR